MAPVTNQEDGRRVQRKRSTSGDDKQSSVSQGDHETRTESDSDPAIAQKLEPGSQVGTDRKPAHESRSHGKRRRSKDSAVSTEATVSQRGRDGLSSVKRRRSSSAPRKMPRHINKSKSGTKVDAANDEDEQERLTVIDKDLYTPTAGMTNGLRKDDPRVLKEVFDEVAHVESSEESSGDERPATMFGYYL